MFPQAALEYLQDYQIARLLIPVGGEEPLPVDGVVKLTTPPSLEAKFLPGQLPAADLDPEGTCVVSFEKGDAVYKIEASIEDISEDRSLHLKAVAVETLPQRRRFFRIDADVFINCWVKDEERPSSTVLRNVNISGSGVRFATSEPLEVGQQVNLELSFPEGNFGPVNAVGRVVRVFSKGREWQEAALELVEIKTEEQDKIVCFCLAEQRKHLRLKVRVLDADPGFAA